MQCTIELTIDMKKLVLFLFAASFLAVTSCTPIDSTVSVNFIVLNTETLTMNINDTEVLSATVSPSNATNKTVLWQSKNSGIASVNQFGVVTAVSEGATVITAISDDGGKVATCSVTVLQPKPHVSSVAFDLSECVLEQGETLQINAVVLPEDAGNKELIWTSSDETICRVDNGLVTAIAPGTAVIVATSVDTGVSAQCKITVNKPLSELVIGKWLSEDKLDIFIIDRIGGEYKVLYYWWDGLEGRFLKDDYPWSINLEDRLLLGEGFLIEDEYFYIQDVSEDTLVLNLLEIGEKTPLMTRTYHHSDISI